MNFGDTIKHGVMQVFQLNKSDVLVYKDYENDKQNVLVFSGMKNSEKGRPNNVMFQFPEYVDIEVGDVLQQKNARTLWKVYELDESLAGDTLLFFEAKVRKMDAMGPMPSSINISNVSGNVQIGGHHAQQTITVTNNVNDAIAELHKILEEKVLADDQTEEIADALDVIANAVKKEKTPSLLERIRKKVTLISDTFQGIEGIGTRALPYIKIITDYFSSQPPVA